MKDAPLATGGPLSTDTPMPDLSGCLIPVPTERSARVRLCESCGEPTTPCPHGFNLCPDDRHECQPCADEAEAEHYDALIGEQQADDWAIDARREGL